MNYTYFLIEVNSVRRPPQLLRLIQGLVVGRVIQTRNHIGRIGVNSVTKADKYLDRRGILPSFEHTYVFTSNAGTCAHFLLGETGFQPELAKFFSKHKPRR